MVYIYKKIIGKKLYYYLRASMKKDKKVVVKDLAYLGSSLKDVRKNLDKLTKYKKEIRNTYKTIKTFLESNYYLEKASKLKLKKDEYLDEKLVETEACKEHYIKKFSKEHELTKKDFFKYFLIEFAYNTTSIEGNTITLKEARNLLEEGLTPKNRTLREIFDLQNTEKVFFEILNSKKDIDKDFIVNLHKKLIENIDDRIGFRRTDVRVLKSRFKASPAKYVITDINLLLKWYNDNKKKLHPLVLAALFHHKFEKIHPFYDGNGRTGRMLLNYILIRNNYPPLIIRKKFRKEYLNSLGKADESPLKETKKEDYFELVQYVANELITNYWNLFLV
ncbi:Fic family protein [Candidatus Pacearchaeota archaeon]|nr:Fic family protein [Candidatus Pacearchaeota archaeon]